MLTREDALAALRRLLEPNGYVSDPADMAGYLEERRGLFHGAAAMVVKPASTSDVSEIVRICASAGLHVVPQGGNTGLCGGGVPLSADKAVLVSMSRMNAIRDLDANNFTITAEAGCILADIQNAAAAADRLFPVSLGAEGSCQIGGNVATNAGGIQVLRYGNMREQILGLEVVLPDGTVWDGLRRLRKDNTGYDLKQLFIGSEGTLGIVTAAALRLYPALKAKATAFVAVAGPKDVLLLFAKARARCADLLTALELIPRMGLDFALRHIPGLQDPLSDRHPWYVLIEVASSDPAAALDPVLEGMLTELMADGIAKDAAVAVNLAQAQMFWRIREGLVEAQREEGSSIKHDISVPVASVPEFIERATAAVSSRLPGIRPVAFGHFGDGNVHFNLSQPIGADKESFLSQWPAFNRIVHDIAVELGGSISAEHGIGLLKRDELRHYRSPIEIDLMRRVKSVLDPQNLMNPGKLI